VELIRRFTAEQYSGALEAWRFLGVDGKQPLFCSPFGDVFLQSDDGVWFLDVVGGTLSREWSSVQDLEAALNTVDGQSHFLMVGLAQSAADLGLVPSPQQVIFFKIPPMVGGALAADNLELADMVVAINLFGQIHQQTRHLPPGTRISGLRITD
jgi:hypothetical protein